MNTSVGLSISTCHIALVVVRRGKILCASGASVGEGTSMDTTIRELLASVSRPPWRRHVKVTVGPSLSQVKRLTGLPPLQDSAEQERLVREGCGRFFLHNGASLIVTGLERLGPDAAWAGVIDESVVRQVRDACEAERYSLSLVAPTVIALRYGLENCEFSDEDGGVRVEVTCDDDGRLATVRRRPVDPEMREMSSWHLADALSSLGEDASLFAAAYGGAMIPRDEPLVARAGREITITRSTSSRRIAVAALCCGLAAGMYATVPTARAFQKNVLTAGQIAAMDDQRRTAFEMENELRRVTEALSELSTFASNRRSAIHLLASIAEVLPEGSILQSVRIDGGGGTLVALTPRAALVVGPLGRMSEIASVEITGSVTRQPIGNDEMERVTLRIGFATASSPAELSSPSTIDDG